jgi:hypothetical protein
MLPLPSINFFPKAFQDDSKAIALGNKLDSYIALWTADILGIKTVARADMIPGSLIDELGFLLNANIMPTDTEVLKRQKVAHAIERQVIRGTWTDSAKVRIDDITGLNSAIYISALSDDWILCGDGITETSASYWGTMGCDGIDDALGLALIGDGTEIEIQGNVYINLHVGIFVSTLTNAEILAIVADIGSDIAPAYFRIYLGYENALGQFELYANGTIG